jgi:hypothetical protein
MKTECNVCGCTSNIQSEGNGCHTCLRGIMIEVPKPLEYNKESEHIKIGEYEFYLKNYLLNEDTLCCIRKEDKRMSETTDPAYIALFKYVLNKRG